MLSESNRSYGALQKAFFCCKKKSKKLRLNNIVHAFSSFISYCFFSLFFLLPIIITILIFLTALYRYAGLDVLLLCCSRSHIVRVPCVSVCVGAFVSLSRLFRHILYLIKALLIVFSVSVRVSFFMI